MKATGIVRRIDDLGRVVIPKEIRRTLRIREGDPLEIFTDREGEIILKKYSPIGELAAFAGMYADSLAKEAGCLVCICDMDQVVAASGNGRKEVQEKYIFKENWKKETVFWQRLMRRNISGCSGNRKRIMCGNLLHRSFAKEMLWGQLFYCHQMKKRSLQNWNKSWGHVQQDFLESKWSDKICRSSHIRRICLIPCGRQGGKRWRICKKI